MKTKVNTHTTCHKKTQNIGKNETMLTNKKGTIKFLLLPLYMEQTEKKKQGLSCTIWQHILCLSFMFT